MEGIDANDAKFVPFPEIPGADCIRSRCVFEDMQLAVDKDRAPRIQVLRDKPKCAPPPHPPGHSARLLRGHTVRLLLGLSDD